MKDLNQENSIKEVLEILKEKERDILVNRFGLFGGRAKTLASIGKDLGLTRERIRQIQNSALSKIKNSEIQQGRLFLKVQKISQEMGGLVAIKDIKEKLRSDSNEALFILETTRNLKRVKGYKNLSSTFIDKTLEPKKIINAEKEIISILKQRSKAVKMAKLLASVESNEKIALSPDLIESLIEASSAFAFDWQGRVGLSVWREINPKSARDKSYYILKKEERPLHFTHIADLIAKEDFVGKNPTAATVHNELILDPRFVLVGRGIYALAEWGFRGGTVEEVIKDILAHHPQGLKRDAIIEEVLKSKLVARNTVMMNLLVKKQFARDKKGLYKLAK